MNRVILLAATVLLVGCAGARSDTMIGTNLFAQWAPTPQMLEADPDLVPIRWYHGESIQLGSVVSVLMKQVGENPPELVHQPVHQAGPMNAMLGAGGMVGAAAVLDMPDCDTNVSQEGGGAKQIQGQLQGQKQGQKQGQRQGQKQGQKQKISPKRPKPTGR